MDARKNANEVCRAKRDHHTICSHRPGSYDNAGIPDSPVTSYSLPVLIGLIGAPKIKNFAPREFMHRSGD
jgi:hypothetical protein